MIEKIIDLQKQVDTMSLAYYCDPEKIKEIELTRGRLCIDFYPKSYLGGLFKIIPKKYILDFDNENNKSLIHKLIKNDIDKLLTRKNKSAVLKEILT